jgi:hemerythrin
MHISWSDDLATGDAAIDSQHKILIQKISSLLDAFEKSGKIESIGVIIRFMEMFVKTHFNSEELVMESLKYPQAAEHVRQHRYFAEQFASLKEKLETKGNTPELAKQAKGLLVDWFVNHIKTTDMALGAFLKEKKGPRPLALV